jgi:hypothetical protein
MEDFLTFVLILSFPREGSQAFARARPSRKKSGIPVAWEAGDDRVFPF